MAVRMTDMSLAEFERRLLDTENPLTEALNLLFGSPADWTEEEADRMGGAILGAIAQAREDAAAGVLVPPAETPNPPPVTIGNVSPKLYAVANLPGAYRCSSCGHEGPWGEGWRWYSAYVLMGTRRSSDAGESADIEYIVCPACATPMTISSDVVTVRG